MKRPVLVFCALLAVAGCSETVESSISTSARETTASSTTTTTSTTAPPATTTTTVPPLSVAGKVVDGEGEAVTHAEVAIGDERTRTGADGFFDLITHEPGTLVASKPGWTEASIHWDESSTFESLTIEPRVIRGIRVSADAAGDDTHFRSLLALARQTAVNAFVFDTKQEGGEILYESSVGEANEIGAVSPSYDPHLRISEAHEQGLYTITRIVVFEDAIRVRARPEEKLAGVWVDPRHRSARAYNIALAKEACELGFDEIQFDYVRFPSGRTAEISGQLDLTQEERVVAIANFLAEAAEALSPLGCPVSADIFSIVVSVPDDQGIGQRPEELSQELSALSPMIYPSHYSLGWLGLDDPNDHPYDVTADAIDDALARISDASVLRPWLQAFWWSDAQIRRAIQAAEDRGVGWILWNVRSNFDLEAVPTDAEVAAVTP